MADETTTVPEEQALFQLSNGRYIMDEAQSRVMFQIKEAQPEHSHPISGTGYSWDESGMADWTEEYQYDENGVLTKKVSKNFRGMTEEYEYKNDEHGNPIEIGYTEKEHDEIPYSSTETYSYEYGAKKIVAVGKTDRGGVKRTYEYQKSQSVITPESDIF